MFISFFRYLIGTVKILIKGYSPERFLNLCKNKNIIIWDLESTKSGYTLYMKASDFRKLKPIVKKTHTKIVIEDRFGLPFFFHKYRKRKAFFIGLLFSVILIYSLTFFVWKIEFIGNQKITDEVLLEYLKSIDVSHGMPKSKVNCENIAKQIRKDFDELIWVSVSIDGTNISVHVREKDNSLISSNKEESPCDIIAEKGGTVTNIITRSGVPNVKVGDEVMEGDLLISGKIEVLNDAKEVVAYHYVSADADIILENQIIYDDYISKKYETKKYTNNNRTIRYLKVGSFMIHFGFKKNKYKTFEQTSEEKQLKLSKNFYLPVYFGKKEIIEYKSISKEYTDNEMEKILLDNFTYYCQNLEADNIAIIEKNHEVIHTDEGAILNATLKVQEAVGIERKIIDLSTPPMIE